MIYIYNPESEREEKLKKTIEILKSNNEMGHMYYHEELKEKLNIRRNAINEAYNSDTLSTISSDLESDLEEDLEEILRMTLRMIPILIQKHHRTLRMPQKQ